MQLFFLSHAICAGLLLPTTSDGFLSQKASAAPELVALARHTMALVLVATAALELLRANRGQALLLVTMLKFLLPACSLRPCLALARQNARYLVAVSGQVAEQARLWVAAVWEPWGVALVRLALWEHSGAALCWLGARVTVSQICLEGVSVLAPQFASHASVRWMMALALFCFGMAANTQLVSSWPV